MKAEKSTKSEYPPVVTFVGKSGSGKTTLVVKLIQELTARGIRVGSVKHDVHSFEMDVPGKDSYRHKHAGAVISVISNPEGIGMVKDADHDHSLPELLEYFTGTDIVISEGFKRAEVPKIEIFRQSIHSSPLCIGDEYLIGFVTDSDLEPPVPRFDPDDTMNLVDFLLDYFGLREKR